ncbi:MAG: hypothetical protein C5B52_12930 [Bacteroidetes bacterium]|nr:MAG: hypothetical protein C5B52_12930 [Bacteroidota bacterium]
MKSNSFIYLLFLSVFTFHFASAQQSVQFVENKGQWDKRVLFKGRLNAGSFYLQKEGFTVLLHDSKDMEKLRERVHGEMNIDSASKGSNTKASGTESRSLPVPNQPDLIMHSHSYYVNFVGGNTNADVVAEKPIDSYENYFIGNDPSKWASNCKVYQVITYKNVYPNVDVRYYAQAGQLKYDIVVYPGADINKIAMKYTGTNALQVKNRQLMIRTSVGDVKELAPYSYHARTSGREEVDCKYVVDKDNTVRFKVKNYSSTEILVIDPTLIFSSFTNSPVDEWGYTATYGPDGSLYSGGIVFGDGFPTTPGAFQTNYQGGAPSEPVDIGIMKFSPNGNARVYATYLGGSGNEHPHSLFVDPQGQLVVIGRTSSSDPSTPGQNYPLFPAGNLQGTGGGYDLGVTKFNASGTALIGSMRIGGAKGDDAVNVSTSRSGPSGINNFYGDDSRSEVILDGANNIYIAACSQSSDFPTTATAFQKTYGGGSQDGVVLKISPNVDNILFSSFLGGSDQDGAFVIALNPLTNDIYVGGATKSSKFPGTGPGTINATFQGGTCDGFVSVINNTGTTLIKSTYIGTGGVDAVYGLKFDKSGFPYIMGTTTATWPIINATAFNPGSKQFLAKLRPDLSAYVYSTVFGSGSVSPNISPVAFLVDRCENVYVSGWGGSLQPGSRDPYLTSGTFGMPTKNCNVLPNGCSTDGRDFYFFVMEKDAKSVLFAAFFGQQGGFGDHVDGGTSRFDFNGIIYQAICANCLASYYPATFPTSPGVIGPRNGNPNACNLAAVKIEMDFSGVKSGVRAAVNGIPHDTSGCAPLLVAFTDTLKRGLQYEWHFGDGSPTVTTTKPDTTHLYPGVGIYHVMLVSIDTTKCITRDTSYTNIRVRTDPANLNFSGAKIGSCQSLTFQFTNLSTFPPGKPFGPQSFTWDFGDNSPPVTTGFAPVTHTYAGPGVYNVVLSLIDTSYCNSPDTMQRTIRLAPDVVAQFTTNPDGCAPHQAVFQNNTIAGQTFTWDFGDGTTSNEFAPTHTYNNVGSYTVTLIADDPSTCNLHDTTSFVINVHPIPTAGFTFAPVPPQENTPTNFTNNSLNATTYRWTFGDGDTSVQVNPVHQYNRTATFNACLVAYNQFGCADTVCQDVEAVVSPLVAVPNAFTPNGDGVNDQVRVRGYAIAKMAFRIYNRWGQLVFQSSDPDQGWDGKYKGVLQPMDAYAYTLDVEFTDGTRTTKKGDITLLR